MDAVALEFILGDRLIGAIFEDEPAGEILGCRVESESEAEHGQTKRR